MEEDGGKDCGEGLRKRVWWCMGEKEVEGMGAKGRKWVVVIQDCMKEKAMLMERVKAIPLKLFYYQTFFETWPD